MNKRTSFRVLPLLAMLGILLSACSGGGSVAASVNGVDITDADVDSLISDDVEVTAEIRAQTLSTMIQWEIVSQTAAGDFDIAPTDEEIAAEQEVLLAEFGLESIDDFLTAQQITQALLNGYLEQTIIQRELEDAFAAGVEDPTAEELAGERDTNPTAWIEVCARHILVETDDEATDVIARLDAGEEFGTVAGEVSIDTASGVDGGDLGCSAPYAYVDPFADATLEAPIGEVYGPVESQFGFHIITVDSREEVPDADIAEYLTLGAIDEAAEEWFTEAIASADVTVDDSYGTWVTEPSPTIIVTG